MKPNVRHLLVHLSTYFDCVPYSLKVLNEKKKYFLIDEDLSLTCEMADMSISGFFEWDF